MLIKYLLIAGISFAAMVVQTASGFGYGIIVMALFPMFLNYTDALTTTGVTVLLSTVINIYAFRKEIQFKKVLPPLIGFLITGTVGTRVLSYIYYKIGEEAQLRAQHVLKLLLGIVMLCVAVWMMFFSERVRIKPTVRSGVTAGVVSGVMGSVFSMGGPPIAMYFLSAIEDNKRYYACIQAYFFCSELYFFVLRSVSGMITTNTLIYAALTAATLFPGIWLGKKVFSRLDYFRLRRFVYIFMVLMSIFIILKEIFS